MPVGSEANEDVAGAVPIGTSNKVVDVVALADGTLGADASGLSSPLPVPTAALGFAWKPVLGLPHHESSE